MRKPLSLNEWQKANVPSDGSQIHVESTSATTASVTPIIISQSNTDVTRILFQPILVDNKKDPANCLSGTLIYEKRRKSNDYPTEKISPCKIKAGEIMELKLDTESIMNLFQAISLLYEIYFQDGIPYGSASYKRIDSSFRAFLDIIQNDPSAARMIGNKDNFELVKELLQLITRVESRESLKNALQNLQRENIEQISQTVTIERLNRAISLIEDNISNAQEEYWQSAVFKENQWILSQLFSSPCTIFQDKAYVGGKCIDNSNGNVCDFLYQNEITNNVVLIEIKTPKTPIIHDSYRHTFSFSYDMSGAVNQVINYRDSLMKEYSSLVTSGSKDFVAFSPRCVVIIGTLSSLTPAQIAAFENYRHSLNNIEIVTFDEILHRLKDLRGIFSTDHLSRTISSETEQDK